ncbi:murein L,D-transpeptidase catalytic domain family protein [Flavobacterium sp. AC]|uniref:Murein L,D-transpeptidase catalytic domain family protein n=1 Tax=Flavobacterium azizsancarii TaxID=2961580 RepID=A0ABT4W6E4_9FLAO|nr:murein L,D-transpeptidase catalytic domain family protein [Flavobacterium azizsancarii]MDA6068159.1 murein L,D-transpeptidase catalytic domain family protein [Flavobacterium azizsancarii]
MKNKIFFLLSFAIFGVSFACRNDEEKPEIIKISKPVYSYEEKLKIETTEIRSFLGKSPKYNSDIVFFLDMKIESGKNRFFIYDLKQNKILSEGLVGHGSGSETGIPGKLKFSNVNNSNCSSLGKYAIGSSYSGRFGKAYKLYGLDATNSNAFDRNIVLHKYSDIPFEEQLNPICNSLGCPMVNENFFTVIEKIIDNSKKKIILVMYY